MLWTWYVLCCVVCGFCFSCLACLSRFCGESGTVAVGNGCEDPGSLLFARKRKNVNVMTEMPAKWKDCDSRGIVNYSTLELPAHFLCHVRGSSIPIPRSSLSFSSSALFVSSHGHAYAQTHASPAPSTQLDHIRFLHFPSLIFNFLKRSRQTSGQSSNDGHMHF